MENNSLYSFIFGIFGAVVIGVTGAYVAPEVPRSMLQSSLFSGSQSQKEEFKMTQEQLVDLVKPSIVRVVKTITFKAEVPAFLIDFDNGNLKFDESYEPYPVEYEESVYSGSGFIVNPDGYIVTNAHVVSDEELKRYALGDLIGRTALLQYYSMTPEQLAKIEAAGEEEMKKLVLKLYKELDAKTIYNIEKKITVINPSSDDDTLENMIANGFPAEVVKINDDYYDDSRDIAVIKIAEEKLPALKLAASQELNVGSKIYVFGFPSTAEFSRKGFIEPTFSQGAISAIKESEDIDFKILQLDAKVSEGSSGSPMIDDKGKSIGIVTYQTGSTLGENGDRFAFAIPIDIVKSFMEDASVENALGNYAGHFEAGLKLKYERRCKKAIEEFDLAREVNENFDIDDYIDSYVDDCEAMISKGESIDSKWDEAKEWMKGVGYVGWAIIGGGVLVVIVLIVLVALLAKKMKKKEKEINHLEDIMLEEAARENVQRDQMEKMLKDNIQKTAMVDHGQTIQSQKPAEALSAVTVEPKPVEVVAVQPKLQVFPEIKESAAVQVIEPVGAVAVDSGVAAYVKQSREAGFDEALIAGELKKSGWSDEDIKNALAAK